jgi:hypothetical protein
MKILKIIKGSILGDFFRTHFSDFYTTSPNHCILPIRFIVSVHTYIYKKKQ